MGNSFRYRCDDFYWDEIHAKTGRFGCYVGRK